MKPRRQLVLPGLLLAGLVAVPGTPQTTSGAKKKTAAKQPSKAKKKTTRPRVPKPPAVTPAQRAASSAAVETHITSAVETAIQNPAALVAFFELLYRHQQGSPEPLRALQFGDSHTASDDWANAIRSRFQQRFGAGGPGFVHAGRPYRGFRRFDSLGRMTKGWKSSGLLNRQADGLSGLSGVSIEAAQAGETVTLDAEGSLLEILYLKQPGGGSFRVTDGETDLGIVDTAGETAAGYFRATVAPGVHRLTITTLSVAPVRLQGWVVENPGGVTWETLGINGAQADLQLAWDERLAREHLERRNPSLIVLAYGTNEAGKRDWTYETYRAAFAQVIARLRAASPVASILVIGPPDRLQRSQGKWVAHEGLEKIVTAQRDAALTAGCAFWNLRAAMGGKGSMRDWVRSGLAQGDFVHFTGGGYRLLGEAMFEMLMAQYDSFLKVRQQILGNQGNGQTANDR